MQLGMESYPILHNTTRHIKHIYHIPKSHVNSYKPRVPFMGGTSANRVRLDQTLQNAASFRSCIDG